MPVRALGRNAQALARFAPAAETAAVDMREVQKLTEACRGIDQIVATANNNLGRGQASPGRTDVSAYQNLCAAARNASVRRLIYVSFRGVTPDAPVDIFRIKWYIEDAIKLFESLPLTRDHAYRLARNSFAAAFLDDETKAAYLRQVDDYFATA